MNQNKIYSAIQDHKIVQIYYNNDESKRIVEPHILYESSTGNILLDAYQTSGYSKNNESMAWKSFNIEKIQGVEITENTFTLRSGYNPNNQERYINVITKA